MRNENTMKYITIMFCLILAACGRTEVRSDEIYGMPSDAFDSIPLEAVVSEPESYTDRPVRVAGTVHEVCQMDGCWLMLRGTDSKDGIRVTAEIADDGGYTFTVPTDISGRHAIAFGTITVPDMDAEAHYQQDTPSRTPLLSMVAAGVRISPEESR